MHRSVFATLAVLALPTVAQAAPGVGGNGKLSFAQFFGQINGDTYAVGMSDDGRFAAYSSSADNIVPQTNTYHDIFRYDRVTSWTLQMSMHTNGTLGNGESFVVQGGRYVSADGRYVLYTSSANNLVDGDTNGLEDAFLRDTDGLGSTTRVSLKAGGVQIPEGGFALGMNADASKILFTTRAALVAADTNNGSDGYVYDRNAKTIKLASSNAAGAPLGTTHGSISDDGRYVAFVAGTGLGEGDIYRKDLNTGAISLVSASASGVKGAASASFWPVISGDGTKVAFVSWDNNLVPGDTNTTWDAFVKTIAGGAITRISVTSAGAQVASPSCIDVSINTHGTVATMGCSAALVPDDTNGTRDVYAKDLTTGTLTLVSRVQGGVVGNNLSGSSHVSSDGSVIVFASVASNLYPLDTNNAIDVFLANRL